MIRFYRWFLIAAGLWLLKYGLANRLKGNGARWLQPYLAKELVNREKWILNYCKAKSVFHIGFADAPYTEEKLSKGLLLHTELIKVAKNVTGIDVEEQAVKLYRNLSGDENVRTATMETITSEELRSFEIIVAGEIVEHLRNPSEFLNLLHQKMYVGQELLISVPNYISYDSLAAVLNHTESVHPDHEWYFSPYTLSKKFDPSQWNIKALLPAMYGRKDETYNFVKRSFPGLSDCLIAVVQKL